VRLGRIALVVVVAGARRGKQQRIFWRTSGEDLLQGLLDDIWLLLPKQAEQPPDRVGPPAGGGVSPVLFMVRKARWFWWRKLSALWW